MATARLRHAFRYPTESDSDEPPEGIDEQEQETLITHLSTTDATQTLLYTRLLLSLPLTPTLLYLPTLLRPTSLSSWLSALFTITSLLAAAYILYYLPLPPASSAPKPPRQRNQNPNPHAHLDIEGESESPLRRYIVYLNGTLVVVLALRELSSGRGWREGMAGGGYVPGFVYGVVLFARTQLRAVDVGVLEGLRYRYKGA
ncbi:uncharacterized protein BDZ99DRAFT_571345 [Mytilinidion resinicola]|uniref:Uncharacterized protein n=1 Tax=Mytilinidion resinicola TaxID=574789 RepID=A0A6A6YNV6_9PEZI|nr:uncharacterized protein BDZ99DRAFT_571345 [Mytilinidion resinicola]KAF2809547.1 hypothetical protein BDZ99DRAFT_571345 [Mytilinidion resinicola]